MRHCHALFLAAGFLAAVIVGACGGKPTAEDCKKFADHYVALMSKEDPDPDATKSVADGMKPKLIADCERYDKATIECSLRAQTMEEVDKCDAGDDAAK
jgi:hypothetical protein